MNALSEFFVSNNPDTTICVNWFGFTLIQSVDLIVIVCNKHNFSSFKMGLFAILQTRFTQAQKETFITLSDHEPVISTINLKKWK